MRHAAFVLFALAGFTAGCGKTTPATPNDDSPGAASDKDRLLGVWAIESYEMGNPLDPPPAGRVESTRFIFDGDKLRIVRDGEDNEKSSFVLDTASNPKVLIVTQLDDEGRPRRRPAGKGEGEVVRGELIYKFDGEALVIALPEGPAGRPTDFTPKPGSGTRATKRAGDTPYAPPVDVIRLKKTNEPIPAEKPRARFRPTKK